MFTKATVLSLIILSSAAASWFFGCARVTPSDVAAMTKKIEEQKQTPSHHLFSTTQQQRKGVVKEIWLTQEDHSRLHYRIFSTASLLTLQPKDRGFDLIEKLQNMECWMQDKLYQKEVNKDAMQQIRFLAAKEGLYCYSAQQFLAQSVAVSLYRLNGSELPQNMKEEKPFLKGNASDISFTVGGRHPQFKAENFKAELGGKK